METVNEETIRLGLISIDHLSPVVVTATASEPSGINVNFVDSFEAIDIGCPIKSQMDDQGVLPMLLAVIRQEKCSHELFFSSLKMIQVSCISFPPSIYYKAVVYDVLLILFQCLIIQNSKVKVNCQLYIT